MLSAEKNELLTRVGPGTPCGELMRRYWQPAALSEELPPGGAPLPIRLLGEDLVLFRDEHNRPGLLGIHCSHRAADLSYGRVEDGGLRCLYHGWLYDIQGNCMEQPGEPAGSDFKSKIHHPAYPCVEKAGMIFAYMGPGEPALFPNYAFLNARPEFTRVSKLLHECSYLQANEGNYDLSHLTFLHYTAENQGIGGGKDGTNGEVKPPTPFINGKGSAPGVEVADAEPTPYGVRSYKIRRDFGNEYYHLYLTEFVLPDLTVIPGSSRGQGGYAVNWHVPIDDTHHWKYSIAFKRDEPLEDFFQSAHTRDAEYRPLQNKRNRYLQDRESMKAQTYTGLGRNFVIHDLFATESEGPIQDRTREHLGAMDKAVIAARNVLLKAIVELQEGQEPANVVRDPEQNQFKFASYRGVLPESRPWQETATWLEEAVLTRDGDWTSAVPGVVNSVSV